MSSFHRDPYHIPVKDSQGEACCFNYGFNVEQNLLERYTYQDILDRIISGISHIKKLK